MSSSKRLKVAISISPLCRITEFNLAADIIRSGLESTNTLDWQQQSLGAASESQLTGLTVPIIKQCIGAPPPPGRTADVTLCGIDIGRSEDFIWVCDFYKPLSHERLAPIDVFERSIRVVRFGGGIMRSDLKDKLTKFGITYGLIDNEPSRESSMEICRNSCLEMADQRPGLRNPVQKVVVEDGGISYDCWAIRNEKFLSAVLENFIIRSPVDNLPLYRLPAEWERWVTNNSPASPLVHLTGPSRDPVNGKWQRGPGNNDDLFYSAAFCESSFYLHLTEKPDQPYEYYGSQTFHTY